MVLANRLSVSLLLLGLGACNESLFDAHLGGKDASVGPPGPDGAPLCPEPCKGDAVGEFSGDMQGGSNMHWTYRSDSRAASGADYADMVKGSLGSDLTGWIANGTPAAGIASCNDSPGAIACKGLQDHLLFRTTTQGGDARDPVLSFTVPESGVYRLTGQYRLPDGGTAGVEQRLLVSRNARHDFLFVDSFKPSLTPGSFDLEVEAALGDHLLVETSPLDSGATSPVGMRFFASRADPAFPGKCQTAATFDGADEATALKDRCKGFQWINSGTLPVPSVSPELGSARQLKYGTYLQGSAVIDRSGDFTVQFWFKDAPSESVRFKSIYADEECSVGGGMWLTVYDNDGVMKWDFAWMYHSSIDWCNASLESLNWTMPIDFDNWHFYRVSRSKADEMMRVCVDGKEVAATNLPADLNLTGVDVPFLGKNSSFGAAEGTGFIDDFRAFKRALPCSAP